jgi:hypothetical protein
MQIILLPSKFLKEKEKRGNKLQKTWLSQDNTREKGSFHSSRRITYGMLYGTSGKLNAFTPRNLSMLWQLCKGFRPSFKTMLNTAGKHIWNEYVLNVRNSWFDSESLPLRWTILDILILMFTNVLYWCSLHILRMFRGGFISVSGHISWSWSCTKSLCWSNTYHWWAKSKLQSCFFGCATPRIITPTIFFRAW